MDPTVQAIPGWSSMIPATPQTDPLPQTSWAPASPTTPLAPSTPELEASPFASPLPKYEEPLYTEINIPLPPLPKQKPASTSAKSRPRAHTLHSLSPFHHRRSSSSSSAGKREEEWPRIRKEVKSKDVAAAMNLSRGKRSGTVDALAVVPAVLVLSAELFTPGQGQGKKKDEGKWEDGML